MSHLVGNVTRASRKIRFYNLLSLSHKDNALKNRNGTNTGPVPNQPMCLMGWWVGVQSDVANLAKLALRTLTIAHTGVVEVERSCSYYRMCRTALSLTSTPENRTGYSNSRMDGIVPLASNK